MTPNVTATRLRRDIAIMRDVLVRIGGCDISTVMEDRSIKRIIHAAEQLLVQIEQNEVTS